MAVQVLQLRLHAIRYEARDIHSFELRHPEGASLPAFAAGAHIDLQLGNGMVRSYSLCNPQTETNRYVVSVNRDKDSRGGSAYLHDHLRVGETVAVCAPRNNFALNEKAPYTILIAGGIGITPLWCMAQRLHAVGARWHLHYCARSRAHAAFVPALMALANESARAGLSLHFDDVSQGRLLDLREIASGAPPGAHLYCCGPDPMLDAFEAATGGLPPEQVHVEYFAAKAPPASAGGFTVELARSGKVLEVPVGRSILEVVLEAGVDVPHSCLEGICASCETRVLEGVPDHRDLVLSSSERESNQVMMICCSGSRSARLVLDC